MSKPAIRIWCPKCHKRHKLPENTGGMTLRCRRCRFAFRVEDGLQEDPGGELPHYQELPAEPKPDIQDSILLDSLVPDPIDSEPVNDTTWQPAHYASEEIFPSSESAHDGELFEASDADFSLDAETGKSKAPSSPSLPAAAGISVDDEPDVSFDEDYDDILDVLEKPDSDPLPSSPQRHSQVQTNPVRSRPSVVPSHAPTSAPPEQVEPVRQPVTRQQLRAHRNSRQFWMLMTFLFAGLLGLAAWFSVKLFMKPGLSEWERKMLYAMGAPARILPPQDINEGEVLLPANRVKLRGDHIELANRENRFREDFLEPEDPVAEDPADEDAALNNLADGGRRGGQWNGEEEQPMERAGRGQRPQDDAIEDRDLAGNFRAGPEEPAPRRNVPKRNMDRRQANPEINAAPPRQNNKLVRRRDDAMRGAPESNGRVQSREAPGLFDDGQTGRVKRRKNNGNGIFLPRPRNNQPADNEPPNNQPRNNQPRNNQPRNNGNALPPRSTFQPPELNSSDVQLAAAQGIDPKMLQSMSLNVGPSMHIALTGNTVFSISSGNRVSAHDVETNRLLDDEKLDKEVAAICSALANNISKRPAAWVLYKNGQLEKWELSGGEVGATVSLSVRPVFKERYAVVAAGKKKIAYVHEGKVMISDVLEASQKLGATMSIPVDGQVRALRFSADDSTLVAIADNKFTQIDVLQGEVASENVVPGLGDRLRLLGPESIGFSSDLKDLFVCLDGFVESFNVGDGAPTGRYWSSVPIPFKGAVSNGTRLLAVAGDSSSHAALFSVTEMRPVVARVPVAENLDPDAKEELLFEGQVAEKPAAISPYEVSRSPVFGASIDSIQTVSQNRIAFLTQEASNRIAIATWRNGWSVKSLKLDPGMKIDGFSASSDLSRVAIWSGSVIQAWQIVDLESGETKFVSESSVHSETISQIMLTRDGKRIVSGDGSGNVYVSDFMSGKRTGGVEGLKTKILNIATKGEESFVVMDQRGIAKGTSNSTRDKVTPFGRLVRRASAIPVGGSKIAYYIDPIAVNVADVSSHKVLATLKPKERPDFIRFSNDQQHVLLQTGQQISVWDWREEKRVREFRYGTKPVPAEVKLDISDDGKTVAVVTGERLNQILIFQMP